MNRIRLQIPTATAKVTPLYLEPRTPLDGQGGARRQGYDVFNRHYETLGRVTRHRDWNGRTVQWSASPKEGRQAEYATRADALRYLIDNQEG